MPTMNNIFKNPAFYLICAKKYSGKSHLLKWLLYNFIKTKQFDYGIIISATAKVTGEWNIIPNKYIFEKYDESLIETIYEKQAQETKFRSGVRCFILMDDVLGTVQLKSPTITKLSTTGRHLNITTFLITQWLTAVPSVVRSNAEYVICLRQPNQIVLKAIWEQYGGMYGSFKEFSEYFKKKIQDYQAFVINQKTQSNSLEKVYSTIKAPEDIPKYFLKF